MRKKIKCVVCGGKFAIIKEKVYTVLEAVNLATVMTQGNKAYDAIDCPHCGCQKILAVRMPVIS